MLRQETNKIKLKETQTLKNESYSHALDSSVPCRPDVEDRPVPSISPVLPGHVLNVVDHASQIPEIIDFSLGIVRMKLNIFSNV